uniref:Uncharacterized protein TCIL3000_9_620 n=1 Tax=Trypanosoma congolense (strain IL3000) TaxID=1068625 RepID=G0UTF4_TRYCI|nr:unnamed protein product [Trypanosoma congolense IL3000]
MMEEERVRKDDKKQASGVLKPTTTAAGGSGSHAYRSHNNDGDATEEGRSQTAASESERHRLLVSGKEEEGKIDYSNGKEATALEGDDMHLGEDRDSDTDAGNTASHLNKPCFLGALSVALESCGGGDYGDSDGHFTGGVSPYHNGEAYVFPSDKPSPGDGAQDCDSVPHPKHEELISELMQAFWNLHRECRLATDVWCATLMKYMKHDSRTQDYVMPLVTNETLPFFAEPGLPGAGHPNNRCGPTGGSASKMPTAAIGTEVTSATHKEEGSRVSFCSAQQPSDVSPTAFHNYMLGKWCVTTSWILQQQQPQQALKAASGSELKR